MIIVTSVDVHRYSTIVDRGVQLRVPGYADAIRAALFGPLRCRGKFGIRLGVLG
jgi:hypothetical protein